MRIALLADVHGNLAALDAVMADLARREVDQVVTLGDHLSVPYDFTPMADLADRNGRPDWSHALRTGYVLPNRS